MDTKICRVCGEEKDLINFYVKNIHTNSYRGECKQCFSEKYKQKRLENSKNPEKLLKLRENKELSKQGKYKCASCKQIKNASEFHKTNTKMGHKLLCKECRNRKLQRKYQYTLDGKIICSKCGKSKLPSEFGKGKLVCKDCHYPTKKKKLSMIRNGYLICGYCKEEKPLSEFGKNKNGLEGYNYKCKICSRETSTKATDKRLNRNREIINNKRKEKEELHKQGLKKCSKCKEVKLLFSFGKHKDKFNSSCKECDSIASKRRYSKNPDKATTSSNKYIKRRRKKDFAFRTRQSLSNNLRHQLRKKYTSKMGKSCFNYFQFTPKDLRISLENQFDENMSWKNYGKYWEIDHIIPCSLYPLANDNGTPDIKEIQKCYNLKNLRPLEKIENRSKSNKLLWNLIKEKNIYHLLPEDLN